jgi:aryl-alcohol dehydrogenase-like predicted oxidoreductase
MPSDEHSVTPAPAPQAADVMPERKTSAVLVHLLRVIAGREEAMPAEIALAWQLARKPWVVPIPRHQKVQPT